MLAVTYVDTGDIYDSHSTCTHEHHLPQYAVVEANGADRTHRRAMTEVRRRYRRALLTRTLVECGRRETLRLAVKFPMRALRQAAQAIRLYGPTIAAEYGVSPQRQLLDQYLFRLRYDVMPADYYQLRLFLPERRPEAWAYVTPFAHRVLVQNPIRQRPSGETETLDNKLRFGAWCAAHQLPAATVVAAVETSVVPSDPAPALPAADLFSKPRVGGCGRGVCVWRYGPAADGADRWHDDAARYTREPVDAAGLLRALAADPARHPHLVQRRAVNHTDVRDLTLGGLCTVRAVTIREGAVAGDPGAFVLLLAYYRMPVGTTAVDNVDAGGIAAPIDLATGRLGPGLRKKGGAGMSPIDVHPSTGAPITGRILPCWTELQALVTRAHGLLPTLGIIGWDVAITPKGPVLIEGNVSPCALASQMACGTPLGRTAYVARMLETGLPAVRN